ncbi:hypothetical protein [Dermacoccus sp. Ellin185]|uniref:hypothetical protein n=1 Tax=Dermacoccus sp. Ellin185 TaxID=188626 RepID=UPI0002EE9589|nr:hypothetical protein [Dermacoccus sp. Ellin185]
MSASFQATLAGKPRQMSPIRAAVPSVDADELVSEVAGDDSGDDSAALDVSGAADVACDWAAVGLDDMGLLGIAAPDDELPPLSTVLHPASVSEASASVGTMVRLIFMASSWLSVSSF